MALDPCVELAVFVIGEFVAHKLYYLILPTRGEGVRFQSCLLWPLSSCSAPRAEL